LQELTRALRQRQCAHYRGARFCSVIERHIACSAGRGFVTPKDGIMSLILLIILILFVVGGLPAWGYHSFGYGPSGLGGILLLIVLVLLLTGRM